MWTRFMDMHSGGTKKTDYGYIYIEGNEEDAIQSFIQIFGHDPRDIACECCGQNYSITTDDSLELASAYDRQCSFSRTANNYDLKTATVPLAEYIGQNDVLVIQPQKRLAND